MARLKERVSKRVRDGSRIKFFQEMMEDPKMSSKTRWNAAIRLDDYYDTLDRYAQRALARRDRREIALLSKRSDVDQEALVAARHALDAEEQADIAASERIYDGVRNSSGDEEYIEAQVPHE